MVSALKRTDSSRLDMRFSKYKILGDVTCNSLSVRRSLALAGCLAGRGKTRACAELPSPVRVLPDPHDSELPGAELHHRAHRHALRIPARFSAEQPHHWTESGVFCFWHTGEKVYLCKCVITYNLNIYKYSWEDNYEVILRLSWLLMSSWIWKCQLYIF